MSRKKDKKIDKMEEMQEMEEKKLKPESKSFLNYIYLILAIFLIFNWLFNPRYGVFYDPCLTDAMTRDIMGFEGSKNEWIMYFNDSNKLHDLYNNGDVIGINRCYCCLLLKNRWQ